MINNRFIVNIKVKSILTIISNIEPQWMSLFNTAKVISRRCCFFYPYFFKISTNCMPEIYISWSFILCNIHTCNVNRFISWIFTSSEFQLHQKPVLFCLFASSDSLKRLWRASMELISRFMHVYFYFISFITMNNKLSRRCFLKYINRFWE